MAKKNSGKSKRLYERHFAHVEVFDAKGGRFSPLPWCLRRVQWLLPPRQWQLITYLLMRTGPESITWISDKEIAFDLDIGHKKIPPHLRALRQHGFIEIQEDQGRRYVCVRDPLAVLKQLVANGRFTPPRLVALNEDLELMGHEPIPAPLPENVTPIGSARHAVPHSETPAGLGARGRS